MSTKSPHKAEMRATIMRLAETPKGVSSSEAHADLAEQGVAVSARTVWKAINEIVKAGGLHGALLASNRARYFADAKLAMAYEGSTKRARAASVPTVRIPGGPGPAHLKGDPIIPPHVQVQRHDAPPPRFQTVELFKVGPVIRSGAMDFKNHQRHGRY